MKHLLTLTFLSIFGLTFAQIPSYVPSNGLVGWWPFNGNANDESGNGNNGTVNGATLTADRNGIANSAYSFDGEDDYISGTLSNFSTASITTISTWLKYIGNAGGQPYDLYFQLGSYGQHTLAYAYNFNSQLLDLHSNCFSNPYFNFNLQNGWHHLVVVDSLNDTKLFIDGQQVFHFNSGNTNECYLGNANFYIGGGADNQFTTGDIDDLAIWDRALTACEIKDLYNSQLGSANTSSSTNQTAIDSYTWPVNNQTYTQSGVYTDTLVNAAGCDSIITLNLELDFTGIQTNSLTSLKLYPNPVQDVLHIDGLAGKEFEYEVLSIEGKLLQKGKSQGEIAVKELRKGNYVLRIGQQQVSFVKQ